MNSLKTTPITPKLPQYSRPVNRNMITLDDGRLLATVSIQGMPFESQSGAELAAAFQSKTNLFTQLGKRFGGRLALWTHIVKKKINLDTRYDFSNDFVDSFANKYLKTFEGTDFYHTNYYVTLVYKSTSGSTLSEGEKEFTDILNTCVSIFKRFECAVLSITDDGLSCPNIEFLSFLLNNKEQRKPLNTSKVVDVIGNSGFHFGYDVLEIRNDNSSASKYATFFELEGFPPTSKIGMWDFVLTENSEFIITQSILLMKPSKTLQLLNDQENLIESGDNSDTELAQLNFTKEAVAIGDVIFGDYHCSIAIYGDTEKQALENGTNLSAEFLNRGFDLQRSNLKSEFSMLSALPAAKTRSLSSPRTMANLSSTFSLHNYSTGKKKGNPIGDGSALIPLKTVSNSLFYLNLHASESNKNVTGEKYAGHTMLLGASGAGKTTLEGVITAFSTRWKPQIFAIDYNRSTELYIRAYGGHYYSIEEGKDTGINLLQLTDKPELRSFLSRLISSLCADKSGETTLEEDAELKAAIETVMEMPASMRSLSLVLQSVQSPNLRAKLSRWCRSTGGEYSWCLDSPVNKFNPESMDIVGFDSTVLLAADVNGGVHPASEPILAALFYLKGQMQKEGRLFLTIVEEFWMPANFPITREIMKTILKAGRLKSEFMILSSQSPEDAIGCKIFAAIIQQTATKIYLPNPDAEFESYKKCNVNQHEFNTLKGLDKASRVFLVKQSNTSCFAKLDLHGFDDHLPIISGTTEDIAICEKIWRDESSDPAIWIPIFQGLKREQRIARNNHEFA